MKKNRELSQLSNSELKILVMDKLRPPKLKNPIMNDLYRDIIGRFSFGEIYVEMKRRDFRLDSEVQDD